MIRDHMIVCLCFFCFAKAQCFPSDSMQSDFSLYAQLRQLPDRCPLSKVGITELHTHYPLLSLEQAHPIPPSARLSHPLASAFR